MTEEEVKRRILDLGDGWTERKPQTPAGTTFGKLWDDVRPDRRI